MKKYRENNKDKCITAVKKWLRNNREGNVAVQKKWREDNKEKCAVYMAKWWKGNLSKHNVYNAKRREEKRNQTSRLTETEKYQIELIYKKSQELGPNWHVDHIIPLAKDGSNHPDNLQIVRKKYNLEKGSKLNFRLPNKEEVYREKLEHEIQ